MNLKQNTEAAMPSEEESEPFDPVLGLPALIAVVLIVYFLSKRK